MTYPEKNAWGDQLNASLRVVRKFRAGDVCFLNSGSPALTVDQYRSDSLVDVAWHNGAATVIEAFPEACLRRATWLDRLRMMFAG